MHFFGVHCLGLGERVEDESSEPSLLLATSVRTGEPE
jgi:hypothetical protein